MLFHAQQLAVPTTLSSRHSWAIPTMWESLDVYAILGPPPLLPTLPEHSTLLLQNMATRSASPVSPRCHPASHRASPRASPRASLRQYHRVSLRPFHPANHRVSLRPFRPASLRPFHPANHRVSLRPFRPANHRRSRANRLRPTRLRDAIISGPIVDGASSIHGPVAVIVPLASAWITTSSATRPAARRFTPIHGLDVPLGGIALGFLIQRVGIAFRKCTNPTTSKSTVPPRNAATPTTPALPHASQNPRLPTIRSRSPTTSPARPNSEDTRSPSR